MKPRSCPLLPLPSSLSLVLPPLPPCPTAVLRQELMERKSIVRSLQSLNLAPLAIVLYQEKVLRQMAVERKRGVDESARGR